MIGKSDAQPHGQAQLDSVNKTQAPVQLKAQPLGKAIGFETLWGTKD
eukprot:CAMPEP_0194334446 /NCGR_PEP_ID=MMETSP0171-20130528/66157_1 /TAXON_ID=218684 /ORGANISM="Corethron pennatum, Strain L29A3" /LENGTH=46 /DNA_ID= /DNA_START= /DNA_END= /DNA_ORIENTATION=